ncbi:SLAIN motif-containing protein 1a isoform X1 [Pangasianodon hypophthalmus]|uniref:SLAIN motif-containing protein 1a isoform X1 n=1 Tax=Pangasianodon hypophthalmus TaxID=310915 RepID=UPI000EFE6D1D|nr:SLAIN motif-containing protein 1a isoform X1 [Pangasianodon hypophthalmus]
MEAAVMKLHAMADVNGNSTVMDAELEVKKLQELVRKLERQNEQLRTRAANNYTHSGHLFPHQSCAGNPASGHVYSGNHCLAAQPTQLEVHNREEQYACFHAQSPSDAESLLLDELEILDLFSLLNIDPESEDSWLYVSPKAKLFPRSPLSPLQWCRHVFDNPGPEVESAKRSLCYRLDQAKRWRGALSGSSSSLSYRPVDGLTFLSTSVKSLTKPALTEQTVPSPQSSHCSLQSPLIGRSCGGLAERSPSFLYHTATQNYSRPHAAVSPQSSVNSEFSISELDDDSVSMDYKLQDMTDVQVMARLQEESLRQEYATTSATGARRSSSFSVHSGLRRPERSDMRMEEDEEDFDDLPPPQPRLFRTGSMQRSVSHSHNLSSLREPRRCSSSSTQYLSSPSSSAASYTSTETQGYRTSTDMLRKSMPNLIRAPSMLSVPSVTSIAAPASYTTFSSFQSSPSSLRNSQSFDSSSGLARLQSAIPSPGQLQQRVQSIGTFSTATRQPVKATAYVSPTIQGPITMPSSVSLNSLSSNSVSKPSKASTPSSTSRSALPRPASFIGTSGTTRSKIAQPARSLLTPPKSMASLSALRDASWRDGCY